MADGCVVGAEMQEEGNVIALGGLSALRRSTNRLSIDLALLSAKYFVTVDWLLLKPP